MAFKLVCVIGLLAAIAFVDVSARCGNNKRRNRPGRPTSCIDIQRPMPIRAQVQPKSVSIPVQWVGGPLVFKGGKFSVKGSLTKLQSIYTDGSLGSYSYAPAKKGGKPAVEFTYKVYKNGRVAKNIKKVYRVKKYNDKNVEKKIKSFRKYILRKEKKRLRKSKSKPRPKLVDIRDYIKYKTIKRKGKLVLKVWSSTYVNGKRVSKDKKYYTLSKQSPQEVLNFLSLYKSNLNVNNQKTIVKYLPSNVRIVQGNGGKVNTNTNVNVNIVAGGNPSTTEETSSISTTSTISYAAKYSFDIVSGPDGALTVKAHCVITKNGKPFDTIDREYANIQGQAGIDSVAKKFQEEVCKVPQH